MKIKAMITGVDQNAETYQTMYDEKGNYTDQPKTHTAGVHVTLEIPNVTFYSKKRVDAKDFLGKEVIVEIKGVRE